MTLTTKLLIGAWAVALLVGSIFVLAFIFALIIAAFGEVPAVLKAINGLMMPWGVLAIVLMIALRWIAGWSIRKGQAAHG